MNKLTNKQKQFCKEYIIDLNATQAAIRAGYSENTAYSQGQRMLKKVETASYIQELMNKRANKTELTAEKVLNNIIEIEELTKQSGKYSEALKANELLGKHLKLFTDKVEHSGEIKCAINIKPASEKDG